MKKAQSFVLIFLIILLGLVSFAFYKFYSSRPANEEKTTSIIDYQYDYDIVNSFEFSDGLHNPDSIIDYKLNDTETGAAKKYIYYADINKDGKSDRITKTFIETGNAHSYNKYTIELNENGNYVTITQDGYLQTINGASCDLQQIQFKFKPTFTITVIYRPLGDTWNDPTIAYKKTLKLNNKSLQEINNVEMQPVCDVKELF